MPKFGTAAVVGRPNAGKSTLVNALVGEKVAIVSDKPQTTRTGISGILHKPAGQVVFLDTPGIHRPGFKMNRRMMAVTSDAIATADLRLLVVDATASFGAGDSFTLELLEKAGGAVFLLPNKIDLLRDKSRLLPFIEQYRKAHDFQETIPVSALTGDGLNLLLDKIFEYMPTGPPLYPEDSFTDQAERTLVAEMVREKILAVTTQEIPYTTAVKTESWDDTGDLIRIHCLIYVERTSERAIVLGRGGERLKQIGTLARADIEKLLARRVYLTLFVKVRERWRNDERTLDEIGIQSD